MGGFNNPTSAGASALTDLSDFPSTFTTDGAIYIADNTGSEMDESTVILTEGTNTFALTKGTASLDIAAGATLNIDKGLQITTNAGIIAFSAASKTLTVSDTADVSGTNTGDNAANSSSTYIGTTAVALNRSSAALTLAGITLTTPDIGVATATSVNKITVTQPATSAVLTIQDGFTLTVSANANVSGTNTGDNTVCTSGAATTAATLLTTRAIYGNNFDGSAALTQVIASTYGGTGNGFTKFTGPTTAEKTFTLPDANTTIAGIATTQTLTNKRITERLVTTTDDATAAIDTDITDVYELSAVANATVFTLTGTPTDGQKLIVRFKDAGTTKGLTWTGFTAIGVTLPTDTTVSKWHYVGCTYNLGATAWHAIAVSEEA